MGLFVFIFWLVFSFVVSFLGEKREIGALSAFLLSFFLSPVIGFLVVAFSKDIAEKQYQMEVVRLLRAIEQKGNDVSPIVESVKKPINDDDI